jgi:hypothetical protein
MWRYVLIGVALVLGLWSPAAAQSESQGGDESSSQGQEDSGQSAFSRPFRGLFGLGDDARQGMDLSASLFGAYDDNLAATRPGASIDRRYHHSGQYAGGNARVTYNLQGEHTAFGAYGGAATNYYPESDRSFAPVYSGGAGFSSPIGRRYDLRLNSSVVYSPFYLYGFLLDPEAIDEPTVSGPGASEDLPINKLKTIRYTSRAKLDRQLSRSSAISFNYAFDGSSYSGIGGGMQSQRAGVTFTRRLSRYARLRLGYGYRTVDSDHLPSAPDTSHRQASHDLDVGVDYNRALSVSRRTKLAFSSGSTILERSAVGGAGTTLASSTRYVFTGTATLVREIGRTWSASLSAHRGITYTDLFFEPVLTNRTTAVVKGLLGRQTELSFLGSYSSGDVGLSGDRSGFGTYLGSAILRRAISQHLAAFASYRYYHYRFADSVNLPAGVAQELDRNGVRVGLTVWLPLTHP